MNPFLTPLFLARNVIEDKQILALTYRGAVRFGTTYFLQQKKIVLKHGQYVSMLPAML